MGGYVLKTQRREIAPFRAVVSRVRGLAVAHLQGRVRQARRRSTCASPASHSHCRALPRRRRMPIPSRHNCGCFWVLRSCRQLAERVGFEPTVPGGTHALRACTLNHSVTSPPCDGSAPYIVHRRRDFNPFLAWRENACGKRRVLVPNSGYERCSQRFTPLTQNR